MVTKTCSDRLNVEMMSMIRRRHVFYVGGYDPLGVDVYYDMFRRSWQRFRGVWRCEGSLGALMLDSDEVAHWDIETSGPNWQVSTRYEFVRLEHILTANIGQPLMWQLPRALAWAVDDLITGTTARVLRASWRFGLHFIYFQMLLLLWLGIAAAAGWIGAYAAGRFAGLSPVWAIAVGVAAAILSFLALRPLADRMHVIQINNCWPHQRELGRGEASAFDAPIEACARRVVAAARGQVDEIVVVGHSQGGVTSTAVMARALELDPELGRRGPKVVLMTLGSVMPGVALHPSATRMREVIRRLAVEPSLLWIDCQSRKDVMNFWEFDPAEGTGLKLGAQRRNPLIWQLRFKDLLSPDYYQSLRFDLFRLHFQFLKASDRRAPFDYLMLVAGPLAVADWAKDHGALVGQFAEDATFMAESGAGAAATAAVVQN
jgi:hypothetical protein